MVQSNFDPNETNTKSDGETMFEGPLQGGAHYNEQLRRR